MASIDNVEDVTPLVQYVATAGQTEFDFPFPIMENGDIVVVINGAQKTLTTDYSVSGAGEATGGSVTLVSALDGGEIVTIYRDILIERSSDFQQNGPLTSAAFNDELDKIILILQQLERDAQRAIRFPLTNPQASSELELSPIDNWENRYLYINADGELEPAAALTTTTLSQSVIGSLLYPRTDAEVAAGVMPTNYYIRPGYVDRYGAVLDGTTDDSAALMAADAQGGAIIPEGATIYLGNSDIEIKNPIIGENPSRPSIIKGRLSGTGSTFRAKNVKFIADASWTTTNDNYAIKYSVDEGVLDIDNCTFDGVGVIVGGGGVLERISVTHCTFTGTAQNDIVQALVLAAARSILIDGNLFEGQYYRDIKITNAPGSAGDELEPEFANDMVSITNNHFRGSRFSTSEIKQAIDCFTSARKLIVSHNIFALTSNVEYWIDMKDQGSEGTAISAQHEEIIITDNICVGGVDLGGIRVVGAYGQNHEGNRQKAIIARNILKVTSTTQLDDLLKASRFHDVEMIGNIVEQASKAMSVVEIRGANRAILANNTLDGTVAISSDTTNGAGTCPTSHISIIGNVVSCDCTSTYGLAVSGVEPDTVANLIIANNSFDHLGGSLQAIRVNGLGTGWENTVVQGNAVTDNSLAVLFSNAQADYTVVEGNSWQKVPLVRSGSGNINVGNTKTQLVHIVTAGSAAAVTMSDGTVDGQRVSLVMITDGGGTATVTPSNLGNGTTITFDDVGDSADLVWTNGAWHFMGGTATLA